MAKDRLLTPGPTQVPERALLRMARQVTHHRTPEFRELFAEVVDNLQHIFQTENSVAVLAASGTGAMEAAVVNVATRGGKVIVLASGKFAERWRHIAEAHGIEVVSYVVPWGDPFEAEQVEQLLKEHPDALAVFGTLQETSTGVAHDIEAIGRAVAPSKALLVVDGISGAGVVECRSDAWGIDVLVAGSQKALMGPPGVAIVTVSPAAWQRIESIDRGAFYFDLLKYRKALDTNDTPFTPPISLIAALAESLRAIRAEGIENVWSRFRTLAEATRAGFEALDLRLVASRPGDGMTAVFIPEEIDGKAFLGRLTERFGIKVAGGQGPLAGRIFRVAHMGLVDELDILGAIAAVELVLVEMGQPVELGVGVAAASRVLAGQ